MSAECGWEWWEYVSSLCTRRVRFGTDTRLVVGSRPPQIVSLCSQSSWPSRGPALPRAGQADANTAGARPQSSFIETA